MPYFTCTCGELRHLHKQYLPDIGETEPLVCANADCGKEWEIHMDRHGPSYTEVNADTTPGRLDEI